MIVCSHSMIPSHLLAWYRGVRSERRFTIQSKFVVLKFRQRLTKPNTGCSFCHKRYELYYISIDISSRTSRIKSLVMRIVREFETVSLVLSLQLSIHDLQCVIMCGPGWCRELKERPLLKVINLVKNKRIIYDSDMDDVATFISSSADSTEEYIP